jgi:hypothetical protein
MTTENPFGDFEDDFKSTEKAAPGSAPGRVPPSTYKFVLTTDDPKGDGNLIDHEILVSNSTGSKGLKIFCEILEPASIPNPKTGEAQETKGQVIDHVFWVTKKNLPYVMRDISTILGRDLKSMSELTSITWAGRTFEGVVGDEEYQGLMRSRIKYINPWTPEKTGAKDETKKVDAPPKDAKKPADQKTTAATGTKKGVSF